MTNKIDLNYLKDSLNAKDKEQIIKEFIDAELSMMVYHGDDHPAVLLHRTAMSLLLKPEDINKFIQFLYDKEAVDLYDMNGELLPDIYQKLFNEFLQRNV